MKLLLATRNLWITLAVIIFIYAKGRESVLGEEGLYWEYFPILPLLAVWFILNITKLMRED